MYYFRYFEQNHLFIDVLGKDFDEQIEGKIRIQFTEKYILSVSLLDSDGNLTPLKKSSPIRKDVMSFLENQEWSKFIVEHEPIEGIANEDGEIVSPLLALYPHKTKPIKINPYRELFSLLQAYNLPIFEEQDIIRKQRLGEHLHIYYRIMNNIYHICIDEFSQTLILVEKFSKID